MALITRAGKTQETLVCWTVEENLEEGLKTLGKETGDAIHGVLQLWAPQYKRDVELLVSLQWRATKMKMGLGISPTRKGWKSLDCLALRGEGSGGICDVRKCKRGDQALFSGAPQQDKKQDRHPELKWNANILNHQETLLSLWEWPSTDTGHPDWLWNLHSWRYSTSSQATEPMCP